jgi:hypothetical protein
MEQTIHLNIRHTRSLYLWFEPYGPAHPDVLASNVDAAHPTATVSYDYDNERLPDNIWVLHLYFGLKVMPVGQIQTVSTFEVVYEGPLTHILGLDALADAARIAFDKCTNAFKERCDHHGLVFNGKLNHDMYADLVQFVRTSYADTRLPNEGPLLANAAKSTFTSGHNTKLLLKVPFIIMDEVFFPGSDFDHAHNAALLWQHIPHSAYYTLKLRCITIDEETVNLPLMQTMFFLICLDCALQLMVGQYSDRLLDLLTNRGLTPDARKTFLRQGSEYLSYIREEMQKSRTTLSNYENRPEWDRIIRLA